MRTNRIFILLIITIVLSGCSLAGKALYFEPVEQDNWTVKIREDFIFGSPVPSMAEHKCDKINILFRSSDAGEKIYTVGPMLLPVIPTFGIFNTDSGKYGMMVFFTVDGATDDPGLDKNGLSISLDQGQKQINADEFKVDHYGDYWSYYYLFKSSLLSVKKMTLFLNKPIQNCSIPSILYEQKGHAFIALFWLPASAYK